MDIKYIVIHCSATSRQMDIGVKEIDQWHKQRGWKRIGYHFVIRRDGKIELGRRMDVPGAHAYGYNRISWGVCMIGGVDKNNKAEDNFSKEQYISLKSLLDTLSKIEPNAKIVGHRDLSPDIDGDGIIEKWEWKKDCPCFEVSDFIKFKPKKRSIWPWS